MIFRDAQKSATFVLLARLQAAFRNNRKQLKHVIPMTIDT